MAFLLVMFFLVLPKMGQVKDANKTLQDAQTQQSTLNSQLAALKQAETDAPKNRETIRKVDQAIPPTVDQQGFILLMQNAAVLASVDVVTLTPSAPVFDPLTGLSTISNGVSVDGELLLDHRVPVQHRDASTRGQGHVDQYHGVAE